MSFLPRSLFATLLLAFAAAPSWAAGPERLYVFYGDSGFAEVRNPADGGLLATVSTPNGAFGAYSIPGRNDAAGASKVYIVSPTQVSIVDASGKRTSSISFSSPVQSKPGAVLLSPDGGRLLAAGRDTVTLIDTAADRVVAVLRPGFAVGGVGIGRDGAKAFVYGATAAAIRSIDLQSGSLEEGVILPPARVESWASSPDGARNLSISGAALYDPQSFEHPALRGETDAVLRSLENSNPWLAGSAGSAAKAVSPAPATRLDTNLLVTNSGRYFLYRNGALETGRTNRSEQLRSISGAAGAMLWAVSADGATAFTAGAGQLRAVGAEEGEEVYTASLTAEPTALAITSPTVRQSGTLELISPNNIVVAGGTRFSIRVKASDGGPQANIPVFISNAFPATPEVSCLSNITNGAGEATLECLVGEVTEAIQVQLTVSDAAGRSATIFSLRTVVPTEFEGLAKIDGDGARVPTGEDFSLTVQASQNRLPAANVNLTVALSPDSPNPAERLADCNSLATTGPDGVAVITCTTAELTVRTTLEITVTDPRGNAVTFGISIDPTAVKPTGLSKVRGDNQVVGQGQDFEIEVASFRDGAPRARTTLNIACGPASQPKPIQVCPSNAITDDEGHAVIKFRAGTVVFGESTIGTIQVSDFGVVLPEPFRIRIFRFVAGNATTIELVSPEFTSGPVGVELIGFFKVKAVSEVGGMGIPNETVYFSSDGPVTFNPAVVQTNSEGEAETSATFGCSLLPFQVAVGLSEGQNLVDFDVTVEPGEFVKILKTRGDNQSGAPGQQLNANALVGVLADACDNPIIGETVSWEVRPSYAASLRAIINISDGLGRVSALATLGNYGGPLKVAVGKGEVETEFDLAVNLPANELRVASGNGQSVAVGQATSQPLVVQALGTTGFGVGGVGVDWSILSGPAQIVTSSSTTDNVGIAYARVRVTGAGLEAEGVEQGSGPLVRVQASAMGKTAVFTLNTGNNAPQATVPGFVNGGSFSSGWTPGGAGSIFGSLLSDSADPVLADVAPFPTNLAGVSVTVNGTPAPLIFVSEGQINLQVPFQTAAGSATVVINNNGKTATIQNVPVNAVQPGVFEITVEGKRIAAALRQDFSVITPSNPAIPGEAVQLYYTGGGVLSPPVATNAAGPVPPAFTVAGATVRLDGVQQENLGSFYAPGLITANQINFVLGPSTTPGDHELVLTMDGVDSQTVIVPVGAAP